MLVLSRKLGEAIIIGDDIQVIIVSAKKGAVQFGFNAPKNIKILREEIYSKEVENSNEDYSSK